jgi:hypothetical protein
LRTSSATTANPLPTRRPWRPRSRLQRQKVGLVGDPLHLAENVFNILDLGIDRVDLRDQVHGILAAFHNMVDEDGQRRLRLAQKAGKGFGLVLLGSRAFQTFGTGPHVGDDFSLPLGGGVDGGEVLHKLADGVGNDGAKLVELALGIGDLGLELLVDRRQQGVDVGGDRPQVKGGRGNRGLFHRIHRIPGGGSAGWRGSQKDQKPPHEARGDQNCLGRTGKAAGLAQKINSSQDGGRDKPPCHI